MYTHQLMIEINPVKSYRRTAIDLVVFCSVGIGILPIDFIGAKRGSQKHRLFDPSFILLGIRRPNVY